MDMETTMLSVNHLMRANELNFALLTLIPASVIAYSIVAIVTGWIRDFGGFKSRKLQRAFLNSLRRIDRLLNTCDVADYVSQGEYIIELFTAYQNIEELGVIKSLPPTLLEDLDDLARRDFTVDQKRWTIVRMRGTNPLLSQQ